MNCFVRVREANAGVMPSQLARLRGGAQTEPSGDEARVAGDSLPAGRQVGTPTEEITGCLREPASERVCICGPKG